MSCNCTTPCTSTCPSYCGCTVQVPGTCVFYQGSNLTCIDATKGDTYDSILANINNIVCNLEPPSGIQTTLTGCSSITVTQTSATNYNVCLSSATQTQINNNTSNIATLSACVDAGVLGLVSTDGSVTISVDTPSTGCGRILDLSVPAPTPPAVVDGIIYSDSTKVLANNPIGADQNLKNSGASIGTYETTVGLNVGDEIRWRTNGQVESKASDVDYLKFEILDTPNGQLLGEIFQSFATDGLKSSWQLEGTITVLDNTPGASVLLVTAYILKSSKENEIGTTSNQYYLLVNKEIAVADLTTLYIRTRYVRNTVLASYNNNFARQLVVEIRKLI